MTESLLAPLPETVIQADAPKEKKPHRFNSENAKAFGLIGRIKRTENLRLAKERAAQTPATKQKLARDYTQEELTCVRRQIERLNRKMMTAKGGQEINWIASALTKLREQERILDGRPLPGQYRPKSGSVTGQDRKTTLQPIDGPDPIASPA